MKYAKLNDGKLEFSPNMVKINDSIVINPKPAQLVELGYKEYITSLPDTPQGYYPVLSYTETETQILQVWSYEEMPIPEQSGAEYLYEKLFGTN